MDLAFRGIASTIISSLLWHQKMLVSAPMDERHHPLEVLDEAVR